MPEAVAKFYCQKPQNPLEALNLLFSQQVKPEAITKFYCQKPQNPLGALNFWLSKLVTPEAIAKFYCQQRKEQEIIIKRDKEKNIPFQTLNNKNIPLLLKITKIYHNENRTKVEGKIIKIHHHPIYNSRT